MSQRGRLQNASVEMRLHAHEKKIPGTSRVRREIKPDPETAAKIHEWLPPRNEEELQSFLGFANYYRDFVPFHAAKVKPMQELLKKKPTFLLRRETSKSPRLGETSLG